MSSEKDPQRRVILIPPRYGMANVPMQFLAAALDGLPPLDSPSRERERERLVPALEPKIEIVESARAERRIPPHYRRFGVPVKNISGSTRCLCGCGEMVSGSRKWKFGHEAREG